MLKLLFISVVSSIIVINYCACRISSEISHEEEKKDLYSRIKTLQ